MGSPRGRPSRPAAGICAWRAWARGASPCSTCQAPYFAGARLLFAADCVPFALASFHESLLGGRTLLIGCPKLDDTTAYHEKLAAIFRFNDIRSVELAVMEVPCCRGLVHLVEQALATAGKTDLLRPTLTTVGIRGEILGQVVPC